MILPSMQNIRKERCERSYLEFTKDSWKVIEPMTPLVNDWDHELICEYMQACYDGEINRLLINVPPRTGKSYKTHIQLVPYWWIHKPWTKFFNISYADSLAKGQNIKKRDIITSHWYQQNWGDRYSLKDDLNTQRKFENDQTGMSMASSVGGTVTGEGADVIVFDDPHNPKKAESDADREAAVEFFKSTLQNRLNDLNNGIIIVVMQRLHDQDVSGHILASDSGYEHLCLPMKAERETTIVFPRSHKEILRKVDDVLQPSRFSLENIKQLEKDMGSYAYAGQYQQDPTPKGGGMFKKWWWNYWIPKGQSHLFPPVTVEMVDDDGHLRKIQKVPRELPDKFDKMLQSWDMAFKKNKGTDYVAGGVWGVEQANRYFVDLDMKRRTFTESLKAIEEMTEKYPNAARKLVEDKANGSAIIDTLQDKISGMIPINPGTDSKEARADSTTPQIESGNVYLPHPMLKPWVNRFIENAAKFPKVAHDDDIDQMSQALIYLGVHYDPDPFGIS